MYRIYDLVKKSNNIETVKQCRSLFVFVENHSFKNIILTCLRKKRSGLARALQNTCGVVNPKCKLKRLSIPKSVYDSENFHEIENEESF